MARIAALYVTADAIGTPTGGGKVTYHESRAMLGAFGDARTEIWQYPNEPRPWSADLAASSCLLRRPELSPAHAHFYAGTFSNTISILKSRGTHVTYTAAAHDIGVSKREHELLGIPFDYPHLTDPTQWDEYVRGYLLADEVVCPSGYSAGIMRGYGVTKIRIIPHGCDLVASIAPIPQRFVVGYLGQPGPDKGLRYLLAAWQRWSTEHPERSANALLMIAGRGTLALAPMVRSCAGGSVYLRGEVADPRELYDACCVYVQPSASEGWGCEVLEARAHGRPVICSDGAGARDHATRVVPARDVVALAEAIHEMYEVWKRAPDAMVEPADSGKLSGLSWDAIRIAYGSMFAEHHRGGR